MLSDKYSDGGASHRTKFYEPSQNHGNNDVVLYFYLPCFASLCFGLIHSCLTSFSSNSPGWLIYNKIKKILMSLYLSPRLVSPCLGFIYPRLESPNHVRMSWIWFWQFALQVYHGWCADDPGDVLHPHPVQDEAGAAGGAGDPRPLHHVCWYNSFL